MADDASQLVEIRILVIVSLDLTDESLSETLAEIRGCGSIGDVVCSEIQSNLESVPYVREVDVKQPERNITMTVKITPNDRRNPPGKLADAEIHFSEGPFEGLKLIGFSVWERRGGAGGRNVTFPARQYVVNGERRSFALLRPIVDTTAQNRIRDLILDAYAEWEAQAAKSA